MVDRNHRTPRQTRLCFIQVDLGTPSQSGQLLALKQRDEALIDFHSTLHPIYNRLIVLLSKGILDSL